VNKFSVKEQVPERKLVGVLYCDGSGIVVAKPNGALVQISKNSIYTLLTSPSNLKSFLASSGGHRPIYEGDVVEITF